MAVEVARVSPQGIDILIDGIGRHLPFDRFPWFRDATIAEIMNVSRPSVEHLYWPDLDVDLALDSITNPDGFPLIARPRPSATATKGRERRH